MQEDRSPLRGAPEFFIRDCDTLRVSEDIRKKSTRELGQDVEAALLEVREIIRGIHTQGIVLDAFWKLQDSLMRLMEAVNDSGLESLNTLSQHHQGLVSRIVQTLQFTKLSRYAKNSGVEAACERINQSLLSLAQLGHAKSVGG